MQMDRQLYIHGPYIEFTVYHEVPAAASILYHNISLCVWLTEGSKVMYTLYVIIKQ